jgi:replicative DNA helicase
MIEPTGFERCVIGAMLIGTRQLLTQVVAILAPEDFYDWKARESYSSILEVFDNKEPVDALFVAKNLLRRGTLEKIGGITYLHQCVSEVPSAAFALHYAREIAEMAGKRRIGEAVGRLSALVEDGGLSVAELSEMAVRTIKEATTKHTHSWGETAAQMWDGHAEWICSTERSFGLTTGVGALDDEIGGLQPGRLILIAARPGIGKTVLVAQAAMLAGKRGHLSHLFSLEMTTREIFGRMLSARCAIDQSRITRGGLSTTERETIARIGDQIRGDAIVVDARTRTMAGIRAAAEKAASESELALVAVDYLQLVSPSRRHDNRVAEVGEISAALKGMAVELNVPVVAAAQLNRGPEMRTGRVPTLADLRESGSLEADADQVILLHRPDYYARNERPGQIDLIVAKNRHGVSGSVVTATHQLHWSRIVDQRF